MGLFLEEIPWPKNRGTDSAALAGVKKLSQASCIILRNDWVKLKISVFLLNELTVGAMGKITDPSAGPAILGFLLVLYCRGSDLT